MKFEDLTTEYKKEYTEDIRKEVLAFANSKGGIIYIGIDDDKKVIGLKNPDTVQLQVMNSIRDSIKPDVTMFAYSEIECIEGQNIVKFTVQKGTASPYYLAGKGIRPEGVYIRQGSSSVPASESQILKMIKESSGDSFEENRSLKQELTFEKLKQEFQGQNISIERNQMKTLGIIQDDEQYSNLALLLSEQCEHTIRIAVFEDKTKNIFKDRYEFTGSLLQQMNDCYAFIDRYNSTQSTFDGLRREDDRDYPINAIREALLNSLVHRDYAFSASALISIYADRIEFVTIGGLVKGLSQKDIMLGVSMLRNKNLANIFYRLKLIEAYGTGIPKIMESYDDNAHKPLIEISDNAFKITLYNTHFEEKIKIELHENLSEKEKKILKLLQKEGTLKRVEIQTELSISQPSAINYLKSLQKKKIIISKGNGRNIQYELKL